MYMSEYFDFQKLEKNTIEELQTHFFKLDDEIHKLLDIIDESEDKLENLKCALWNMQEIIRKQKKNLK